MGDKDALRALFDEKIIKVLNTLFENPSKNLSLTQISTLSDVSTATTLRILNKLVKKEFAKITIIGKSKFYRLKKGQKTQALGKILRKNDQIDTFAQSIEQFPEVKKIALISKTTKTANFVIVGDNTPSSKIKAIAQNIKKEDNYDIKFVEMPMQQYQDMEKIGLEDISDKIIWERS